MGILVCYIAAAAIEMDKWSTNNDGTKYRVWPSWGWICAIVAGALWFFVGSFAACELATTFSHPVTTCGMHDTIETVEKPRFVLFELRLYVGSSVAC